MCYFLDYYCKILENSSNEENLISQFYHMITQIYLDEYKNSSIVFFLKGIVYDIYL